MKTDNVVVDENPPLPRFAQIEPIGRCNLACRMCTVNERIDAVGEMSIDRFRSLLDQLPGLETLHLQGLGEPMLHPAFFDMVELAAARGIRVSANTNLTLLTPARALRCVTCGLASLSVSIDGASREVYQAIRRKASFDKVVRNLDRLMRTRAEHRSRLEVRGVMVLIRSNLDELPALLRLLHAHGVPELLVQRLSSDLEQAGLAPGYIIPIRDYVRGAQLRPEDLEHAQAVFDDARTLADSLGLSLHLPRLAPKMRASASVSASVSVSVSASASASADAAAPRCRWPWEQIYVTAAGELLPCCMVATADRASFGNVFDGTSDGLRRRWHSEDAQAFRRALASDSPPDVCRGCALYRGTF
ncbi:MAG: radical SAM protein [Burkholderiaceae bacterium]|nr:radical SAM protein [Burkholderiaceae bacterium]